jgi:sugar fermentation stimulation protein A
MFQERPNRFVALVNSGDNVLPCFLPNPGRLHELLVPEREVLLHEASNENRKTEFDLIGVVHHGQMVSVDSRVPNRLVLEALRAGDIEELSEYDSIQSEVGYGRSRFDFFLANERTRGFLEVKSCTLVRDGVALFADAQTERGRGYVSFETPRQKA